MALRIFLAFIGAALSGLVAFLGNKLGRHVGRRKMSIFGLRPKYTSNVITVVTGSLIYLLTLGLLFTFSWEVRQLFYGIGHLRDERTRLEREVADLNRITAAGPVVMPLQPLSVGVIKCGLPAEDIMDQIDTLLQIANANVLDNTNRIAARNNLPQLPEDSKLVGYVPEDKKDIVDSLSRAPAGSTVVCEVLGGTQTSYYKDKIAAKFVFQANPVVFRKDQVIVSGIIDGRKTSAQVFNKIVEFIYKDVPFTCLQQHGMVRNPLSNQLDTSIGLKEMKRAADEVAAANRPMRLQVIANTEIHPLGPLDARLVVTSP